MNRRVRVMIVFLIVIGSSALLIWALRFTGTRPAHLGGALSELPPCPPSPNCVCSVDSDDAHSIAPFSTANQPAAAWAALKRVLEEEPRMRIITETSNYLHLECRTPLFRFVDDLEFLLAEDGATIQVRSASRAGHSDLGTNRRRVEKLRGDYAARLRSPARNVETTGPE